MNMLILGGTVFLGRAIVEAALTQGITVTIFNRGKTNPDQFPEVEKLTGNRDGDLSALEGRNWDVAIDTCGYLPRVVRQSARLLAESVDHYTFISSVSVYADFSVPGIDENAPVATLEDENTEEITGETYGPLKAQCEQEVYRALPNRSLVIRPGLIVGPHDVSDRFTYWVIRVAQGGDVLVPKPTDLPAELIDVRDLAQWTLSMAENETTGTFNAVGPDHLITMDHFLGSCKVISESDARFTWVDGNFLLNNEVAPWSDMPMWLPIEQPEFAGVFEVSGDKAFEAGLVIRPIEETIRDTLAWGKSRPSEYEMKAGISRERERELLKLWKGRESNG